MLRAAIRFDATRYREAFDIAYSEFSRLLSACNRPRKPIPLPDKGWFDLTPQAGPHPVGASSVTVVQAWWSPMFRAYATDHDLPERVGQSGQTYPRNPSLRARALRYPPQIRDSVGLGSPSHKECAHVPCQSSSGATELPSRFVPLVSASVVQCMGRETASRRPQSGSPRGFMRIEQLHRAVCQAPS